MCHDFYVEQYDLLVLGEPVTVLLIKDYNVTVVHIVKMKKTMH